MKREDEYILCAAIWYNDWVGHIHQPINIESGFVICGRRHHNCTSTLSILKGPNEENLIPEITEGFLTNKNRFVDSKEAVKVALSAKQIEAPIHMLYSEDLW